MLQFEDFQKLDRQNQIEKKIIIFGAGTIGRITQLALKKNNIEIDFFCDSDKRKQEYKLGNKLVLSPESLGKLNKKETYIFLATQYFSAITPTLLSEGFKNIFKVTDLLEKNNVSDLYEKIDLKFLYGKLEPLKLQRSIGFYNEMGRKEDYTRDKKLNIKTIDVQVTEKCSLKCKDCSNLMQYYAKPEDSELNLLLKSIDKIMNSIDSLEEFRVLGGDPFMNKELHKIINKLVTYDKCKKVVVYTNAKFVPKGENLNCLKNKKVMLDITDYGKHSWAASEFIEVAKKENIAYTTFKCTTWQDCGRIMPYSNKSEKQLEHLFNNCCNSDLISLLHGKLYRCPFSANGVNLKAIPQNKSDEVDLTDDTLSYDDLREQIKKLCYDKKYLTACSYCNGRDYSSVNIPSALQAKRPVKLDLELNPETKH